MPIIPDEARTFGMDPLFKEVGIYNPLGQRYTPVDKELLLSYLEKEDGQILEEGITEAGAMADFTAAGTSYAVHGQPMIPFYIFYSMFGFQRTGDLVWAFGDARGRGFLMGATAGRTTLTGEGLQHDDGHSHILASVLPNIRAYDPAFAYELAVIVRDGIRRMYGEAQEDVFYYVTLYNENWVMPPKPDGVDEGIVRGLYLFRPADKGSRRVQLLASGSILHQAIKAQPLLAERYDIAADLWSVPSFQQLRNEALEIERWNRLHPEAEERVPYVVQQLAPTEGPIVAATDYLKALPHMVAPLDRPALHRAGHRWLRPQRHARGAAHPLRGEPRADRLRRAPRPVHDRRGRVARSWRGRSASWGSIPSERTRCAPDRRLAPQAPLSCSVRPTQVPHHMQ